MLSVWSITMIMLIIVNKIYNFSIKAILLHLVSHDSKMKTLGLKIYKTENTTTHWGI